MWKLPGVSIWIGLAVLWFWIFLSRVAGWPVLALAVAITAATLLRFGYVPKRPTTNHEPPTTNHQSA